MVEIKFLGVGRIRLPILGYHNVGPLPVEDPCSLTVAPERFKRQMHWLVKLGYETIWPSDWLEAQRGHKPLPRKPVMVTFDDGYAEIVEHAFPVLRRMGLKATVYVVTKRFGLTNTWDEEIGYATKRLMTAEQILEWAQRGIEFGAHTRTHPHLPRLAGQDLADEIEGSKADLEALIGGEVISFAYPYGDGADSGAIRDVLQPNYQLAMTVWEGLNRVETNPLELRRVMIFPNVTLQDFTFRLLLGMPLRNWLVKHL